MLEFVLERAHYWAIIGLMMVGLYIIFESQNLIKKLVGMSIFQTSIILFYIAISKIAGGTAPILYGRDYPKGGHGGHADPTGHSGDHHDAAHQTYDAVLSAGEVGVKEVYSNPLPHVLMLTAIVVGVATLAVGLAIVVRLREAYGSIELDEVRAADLKVAEAEFAEDNPEQATA